MSLRVWLPLNKDPNVIVPITSFSKEGGITLTEDTNGWYKVTDSSHTSSRWGIYYDFPVEPSTNYTLRVYSKSGGGAATSMGIQSYTHNSTWPAVRDTNATTTEKFTTYSWTTGESDTVARVYLAMLCTSTSANNYVFYKAPEVLKEPVNQGLDKGSVINDGAVFSSNGKLGGCYSFSPTTNGHLNIPANIMKEFVASNGTSLAFWIKLNSWNASYETYFQAGTSGYSWGDYVFGVLRYATNSNICFTIGNGSSSSSANYTTSNWETGVWFHMAFTYESGKCRIYKNGILDREYSTSFVPDFSKITKITVGKCNGDAYQTNCLMNDFRIYDHCLSSMEVKELSKGLVLHYPLNGRNETLVPLGYQQLEYIESSGSSYFNTGYKFNPETDAWKVEFKGNDVSNTGMIFADSGARYFWFYYYGVSGIRVYAYNGTVQEGISGIPSDLNKHVAEYKDKHYYIDGVDKGGLSKTYTEDTNTIWLFSYGGSNYPFKGRIYYTDIKRNNKIQKIYIPAKRISDSVVGMYELVNNEFLVSTSTAFTAGPIIKTPSLIYDCSGFINNGTISGNLAISNDTPKYQASTYFNGSSYILTDSGTFSWFDFNQLTLAGWMKPTNSPSSYSGSFGIAHNSIDGYYSKCFSISNSSSKFTINAAKGSTWTWITSPYTVPANEWHHYVATLNGIEVKMYVDGELIYTATIDWGTGTVASDTQFQVGVDLPGSDETYQGYYSDIRAYATALSADDVKSLYLDGHHSA